MRRQDKMFKMHDRGINQNQYELFPIETTVAVQREGSGHWIYGTIIAHGDANHNNRSYKIMGNACKSNY